MSLHNDELNGAPTGAALYDLSPSMTVELDGEAGDARARKQRAAKPERARKGNRKGKAFGFKVFEPTSRSMKFLYLTSNPETLASC